MRNPTATSSIPTEASGPQRERDRRGGLFPAGGRFAVARAPYLRDGVGVRGYLGAFAVTLLPIVGGAVALFGLHVLALVALSYAVGLGFHLAFSRGLRQPRPNEGIFLTAVLFALVLPPNPPWGLVVLGAVFVALARELFGGLGRYPFHPALVGKALLVILFPTAMTRLWEPLSGGGAGFTQWAPTEMASQTPLMAALQGQEVALGTWLGGQAAGLLGGAPAGLLLLAGLWLAFTRAVDWRIPLGMVLTLAVGGGLLGMLYPETFGGGFLAHLLGGGFLLAAFWLAGDPVTSPMTPRGKWIFAVGTALLIVVLRGLTPWPEEAIVFAVLAMNALVPWLDRVAAPRPFGMEGHRGMGKGGNR